MAESRVLVPLHSTAPAYLELFERLATYASSLPQALGGDLSGDRYVGHYVLEDGLLIFTDRHCVLSSAARVPPSSIVASDAILSSSLAAAATAPLAKALADAPPTAASSDVERSAAGAAGADGPAGTVLSFDHCEGAAERAGTPSDEHSGRDATATSPVEGSTPSAPARRASEPIRKVEGRDGVEGQGGGEEEQGEAGGMSSGEVEGLGKARCGLNAHLGHEEIKSCTLLWHVPWSDVGGIKGEDRAIGGQPPPPPPLSLCARAWICVDTLPCFARSLL